MKRIYSEEEMDEAMAKRDPREFEWGRLTVKAMFAETHEEEKIAEANLEKFERDNADLMDEIHTRKWTSYGP